MNPARRLAAALLTGCIAAPLPAAEAPARPGIEIKAGEEQADKERFYDAPVLDAQPLQRSADALAKLPGDGKGGIDWMKALREGAIQPRADLRGSGQMDLLDLDVLLKNTREMPYVKFPHRSHTEWLACSNCHDRIFVAKAGANPITMEKIFRGQYCGVCHGKVAFITYLSCERCHSVPQSGTKAWW